MRNVRASPEEIIDAEIALTMDEKPLFLSLGAGVQSSAALMLYYEGRLKPMPKAAIFADTQAEPKYVYEFLDLLKERVKDKIPILITTHGSLEAVELDPDFRLGSSGFKFAYCPFFSKDDNGKVGIHFRHCTTDYKIRPIVKAIREFMGVETGKRMKTKVQQVIGISTDEILRAKPARFAWIENIFPLIYQMKWDREACEKYLLELGFPRPRRSACVFCPFRSNTEWSEIKSSDPDGWTRAVEFDRKLREVKTYQRPYFVHRKCLPLEEAIALNEYLGPLFDNECEGMCGL